MPIASCAALLFAIVVSCASPPQRQATQKETPAPHPLVAMAVHDDVPDEAPPPMAKPLTPKKRDRSIGRCEGDKPDVAHFTLAHINDMQARYNERIAGRSRYAYVAGYLESLKEQVPETIVLDAGDDYEKGAIAELRSMGETTRQMIQSLPIDARTIGNHDFSYGESSVLRDALLSTHPVLAANIRRVGESSPFVPYARFDVGCVRVGVVGLVTGNYGANDFPTREAFDDVFSQSDKYAQILEEQVRAHRDEVDVMIALDHIGYWEDVALAGRVAGVDLFVGGHSEDLLTSPSGITRADGTHAWILQAGHYAKAIGRADLTYNFHDKTLSFSRYRIINVDATLPFSESVNDLDARLEHDAAPDAHAPIAIVKYPIAPGKPMADLTWRAVSSEWAADALLVGRDLFWDGLAPGEVSLQRLYDTVLTQREPAGTSGFSSLYLITLTGAELAQLRSKLYFGPMYALYAPDVLNPTRTYRLAIEKRALRYPSMAFAGGASLPEGRFAGELIDVLEAYARSRTAKGLPLDGS